MEMQKESQAPTENQLWQKKGTLFQIESESVGLDVRSLQQTSA